MDRTLLLTGTRLFRSVVAALLVMLYKILELTGGRFTAHVKVIFCIQARSVWEHLDFVESVRRNGWRGNRGLEYRYNGCIPAVGIKRKTPGSTLLGVNYANSISTR